MEQKQILDTTETILSKSGFQVSERCIVRSSCFNFVVRREKEFAFIKVFNDIGNISNIEALELKRISKCFSASPLFICHKMRKKPLEDDTVYTRYAVNMITPKTLGNIVFLQRYPLIEAGPGGYYVNLDGKVIKRKRKELGMSIGELAKLLGVSRRTIYGYENGMARASVYTAYNLGCILGIPLAKSIDIFQKSSPVKGFFAKAKHIIIHNCLLQMVLDKLVHLNFIVTPTERAPFDFIAQIRKLRLIGGVSIEKEDNPSKRIEEIASIGNVINTKTFFVADDKEIQGVNIPLIHHEELKKIKK